MPTHTRDFRADRGGRRGASTLTVAVTGASGTVGPALLQRLVDSRRVGRVLVLGRHRTPDMPAGFEFRQVDVRDREAVARGVSGADVVIHMAFALYGVTPGEDQLFATNVEGTLNVARAAVAERAARFVYISSAAVYGLRPDNPQWMTEDQDVRASSRHFYSRHKAQAELVVDEALAGSDTEAYIFRPCAIIGPHAAGATISGVPPRLVGAGTVLLRTLARGGLRPFLPAPPVPLQFLHEDDVAQALELAALGAGEPGIYNLAPSDVVGGHETLALLGFRALPLPRAAVQSALRLISGAPPVVPAVVWPSLATEPLLIDATRARTELGWRPGWTSRAALRTTRDALGW